MLSWPPKDPSETLDFDVDWTPRLNGDVIVTSEWTIPPGSSLQIESNTESVTLTKVVLNGGIVGQSYTLVNTITTAAGSTLVESVQVLLQAK